LALYEFGHRNGYSSLEEGDFESQSGIYSSLVGVAFSLWRAAFLTDVPNRSWLAALQNAQDLLETLLSTNAVAFSTEHTLQGWAGGYYLTNVSLRLRILADMGRKRGQQPSSNATRISKISLIGTDPHETWNVFCDEAERIARELGCTVP
jgi:hypothetical protein